MPSELVLRPYQRDAIEGVRDSFRNGHKRVICVLPCGAGKTVLFAYMSRNHISLNPNNNVLFLVHRRELIDQTVESFERFGLTSPRIKIAMAQTVTRHLDDIEKPTLIVTDECFVADTEIATDQGYRKIKDLRRGGLVASYNHKTKEVEYRKITHLFKNRVHDLVKVRIEGGTELVCTKNHPFYTNEGYVEAIGLFGKNVLLQDLRNWKRVESVEVLEPGSFGRYPDGFVYNIEVEGNNNYFASGILVHNCHHASATTWKRIFERFPDVPSIGLTATPCRLDGKGLGDEFDDMFVGVGPKELMDAGYLSRYDYYAPNVNLVDAEWKPKGSDFDMEEAAKTLTASRIFGKVSEYLDLARQTIVYCPTVAMSKRMADEIGPLAAHFDGDTPKDERSRIVSAFRSGQIRVLCNCNLIGEGFDVPDCDCVMLLRPTKSVSLFVQQSMRCLRPKPGKRATVYDFVGNCYRHGLPTDAREWSLHGKTQCRNPSGVPDVLTRQCGECYRVYPGTDRICPYCGHDNGKTRQEIKREEEAEMRRIEELQKREDRMKQGMAKSYRELVEFARAKGYKNPTGWAYIVLNARKRK